MARRKKEIEPQPSPKGEGSPLDPQPSPTGEGSPLDPSENTIYQNIRTVLATARQMGDRTANHGGSRRTKG